MNIPKFGPETKVAPGGSGVGQQLQSVLERLLSEAREGKNLRRVAALFSDGAGRTVAKKEINEERKESYAAPDQGADKSEESAPMPLSGKRAGAIDLTR